MRLVFIAVAVLSALVNATGADSETEYAAVLVNGRKIGYVTYTRSVADGVVTTSEGMNITITRASTKLAVSVVETSRETVDGAPIGFEVTQNLGMGEQKILGEFNDANKVDVTIEMMGNTKKQTIDVPAGAVMAEGLRLLQLEKGCKEGTGYDVLLFSGSSLFAVPTRITVGPTKDVDLFGRLLPLTELIVVMHTPTGAVNSKNYADKEMRPLKSITPMLGMELELIACDRQFALGDNDVVDFINALLVQSPLELKDVRSKESVSYYLSPIGTAKLEIPVSDNQSIDASDNGKVIVKVQPVSPKEGVKFPYEGTDEKLLEMLKPSRYLQSDDEKIVALARDAVAGSKDAAEAVVRIESFVAGYITAKDLSVGYASAAEVAASRQGDCTEHAVLAAAMCRAVGIPARVVTGLVYIDEFATRKNILGGHAWAEAYIGDKWIGLDATRAPNGYGPGHIALAAGNGNPEDFFGIINTLGHFKIEKITTVDKAVPVQAGEKTNEK